MIGAETVTSGDMIRRKWLDNDFYGIVSELNGKVNNWDLNFGVVVNQYYGRHYGQIISGSIYSKLIFQLNITEITQLKMRSRVMPKLCINLAT